jgi:hypothetical protein
MRMPGSLVLRQPSCSARAQVERILRRSQAPVGAMLMPMADDNHPQDCVHQRCRIAKEPPLHLTNLDIEPASAWRVRSISTLRSTMHIPRCRFLISRHSRTDRLAAPFPVLEDGVSTSSYRWAVFNLRRF